MALSLHYKLFGAFLTAILAVVLYMALVMQWSFDRGFLQYVNTMEHEQLARMAVSLESYYQDVQSWESFAADPLQLAPFIVDSYPDGRQKEFFAARIRGKHSRINDMPKGTLPVEVSLPFFRRVFLLDESGAVIAGFDPEPSRTDRIDLYHQNRVVGTLGFHFARELSDGHQLLFARNHRMALVLVALAGFLIAAGLSLPFSHRLTRPIRRLAAAVRELASGRFDIRVEVESGDEFGMLSRDVNDLADILEKNRQARSRWFADISHELRTPLAILRGRIEAMQDGVYKPDAEMLASLHREVMHLGLLVDDIYQLSLSDQGAMSYNRREVEPCWALEQAIDLLQGEMAGKNLTLSTALAVPREVVLFGDNERLKQLFTNILANAIRYTEEGGRVEVRVFPRGDRVVYEVADSAPGVAPVHLEKLFDRLYRIDTSRSRELGGAGLGLSICYNIVIAHGGTIAAEPSPLGGLLIRVVLPIAEVL